MVKKVSSLDDVAVSKKNKTSLFDLAKKVDSSVEIISESVMSKIDDWIPTGSYILNACISGSLFGGIPSGRITTLASGAGVGKTYLACSVCREAQKKGYDVVYLDSENSIDETFITRLGCKPDNFIIKQVSTVNEVTTFILNLCKSYLEAKQSGEELNPFIIVLDSLGQCASQKELADAVESKHVQDFTRTKEIKKLFRLVTIEIAKCHAPFIVINHVYTNAGSFIPTSQMSGGSGIEYAGTVTLMMTGKKLEDKENSKNAEKGVNSSAIKKVGTKVSCYPIKTRLAIPRTVEFQIPFFKPPVPTVGLEDYLNWDNAGIMVGKCYKEEEYLKLKPNEQTECIPFEYTDKNTGEISMRYAQPKKTMVRGVGIVCKHLGRAVDPTTEFWTPTVFTDEFLHYIDDNIIKPAFELPSRDSFDDINEIVKELGGSGDEDDETTSQSDVISTDIKK